MAETSFAVTFDGPALGSGKMSVGDLAPALLALSDAFAEGGRLLHPGNDPISLNIRATRDGSFVVHLIAQGGSLWDQFVDIFASNSATAIGHLVEALIGAHGLFALVKKLRSRKITAVDPVDPGTVRITMEDGNTMEIPAEVFALLESVTVRRSARTVVSPLERDGIDAVKFTLSEAEVVIVAKDDLPAFEEAPAQEVEEIRTTEARMLLQISSVSFTKGKWRLSDGERTFPASIDAPEFLDRVDARLEVFRAGDILDCRLQTIQTNGASGLRVEHRVLEVLEHRHSGHREQLSLDDVVDEDPE